MSGARTWLLPLLCALCACGRLGCGGDALAELLEVSGSVERDHASALEQWQAAAPGALFNEGDGLRTGGDSTAALRVGRSSRVKVDPNTIIRFRSSMDQDGDDPYEVPELDLEQGVASLEIGDEPLPIKSGGRRAVFAPRSRIALARDEGDEGTRYRVMMGGMELQGEDGATRRLAVGESVTIGIGLAVLEDDQGRPLEPEPPEPSAVEQAEQAALEEAEAPPPGAAVTASITGEVRHRGAGGQWGELVEGNTELVSGDELDVGPGGRARLERGEQRATLSEGQYRIGASDGPLVTASDGNLQLEASTEDVAVRVPGGVIVARATPGGSRADVVVSGEEGTAHVEVLQGQAATRGDDGEKSLGKGERAELGTAAAAAAAAAVGKELGGLHYAEVTVMAGESFRVYDPKPPTAVGFEVDDACGSDGAEVRVTGSHPARGSGRVNVLVGPGLHRYSVHCLVSGEPAPAVTRSGRVRIVRSPGTRKLPTTAPRNDVTLDGRRYSLMYQNLKPIVRVQWPKAPKASGYVLTIKPGAGRAKRFRSKSPSYVVKPRMLRDGAHTLQFETTGKASKKSKPTVVDILFDNAAPTASLDEPPPEGFRPGSSVKFSGVTVAGSQVSIGGREVPLDAAARFSVEAPLRSGQRAMAVRIKHARHGIRYYLRRAAGR